MQVLNPTLFEQLVEDSPDAMFVVDPKTDELLFANESLLRMLGYSDARQLLGTTMFDTLIYSNDRDVIREAHTRRDDATGSPAPMSLRWAHRNGDAIAITATSAMIRYRDVPALLVTARRESELKALRLAEQRSRLLFDLTPVSIVVFDRHTFEFLAVNQAAADLYGYTREEMLRMQLTEVKHPDDVKDLRTEIDSLEVGDKRHFGLRRHKTKAGKPLEIDITSHSIDFDGREALMSIGIDVTEANRLEAQLRQAQKMEAVGQLAGGVAHDFNNLLGVILANVELAIENTEAKEPVAEELREIEVATERATALTRQLLAFSRKSPRRAATVALDTIVANCEKMLSRIVGEDIEMSLVSEPQLASIEADASQMEQVLVNLVINARDAMLNGGLVILETANTELTDQRAASLGLAPGCYVELSVHDTGTGMDAQTRARIFEPFFTTKAVGKGTGLGLSTVFGIVEQSGGAIVVESEPGRGTVFRLLFPAVARHDKTAEVPLLERARGSESVLLVEDDPRLRAVIQRHLHALGYSTHDAPHGHAALEILQQTEQHFDLLLTDLVMPGLDGRALAMEAVRARPGLRVVFMSGYTEHSAVKTARFEHDHFVEKPFTSAKLSHAIRRALQP